MITVTVEKKYGAATIRTKVTAPSIRRAVEIVRCSTSESGEDTRILFPASLDPEEFFARVPEPEEAAGTQPVPAIA